jgi:hypothetical protein
VRTGAAVGAGFGVLGEDGLGSDKRAYVGTCATHQSKATRQSRGVHKEAFGAGLYVSEA